MRQPPDPHSPQDPLQTQLRAAFDEASAVEDPDVLRALDEEFAELTQELQRINSLPQGRVRHDNIEALRAQWRARAAARSDLPPWRRRLDEALELAIERVLLDSRDKAIASGGEGANLNLQLDGDAMMRHGVPVLHALLEGLQQALNDKLQGLGKTLSVSATQATQSAPTAPSTPAAPPAPSATPTASAPADAPADTPSKAKVQVNIDLQGLLGSLLQQLQPKGAAAAAPAPKPAPAKPTPPKPASKGPPPKRRR
jgi:hypothetical protein